MPYRQRDISTITIETIVCSCVLYVCVRKREERRVRGSDKLRENYLSREYFKVFSPSLKVISFCLHFIVGYLLHWGYRGVDQTIQCSTHNPNWTVGRKRGSPRINSKLSTTFFPFTSNLFSFLSSQLENCIQKKDNRNPLNNTIS